MKVLPAVALVTVALPVATAAAQAPGLPRTYVPQTIDSPEPRPGGAYGWGIASADLNGDGKHDLVIAQSQDPASSQAFVFDGASGAHVDTIKPPELNPGGADPIFGFIYVETMPDIGSCPSADGGDADKICDDAAVGGPDGIPEILIGARSKRVNVTNPALEAVGSDPALGRGYIFDGKTRAVLKRIDMPLADRSAQAALNASPHFARTMTSPQALPPCAGSAAENNSAGVGPCPSMPRASRIGDLNGDGIGDIVMTARNFRETPAQAAAGSHCRASTVASCESGKAWAYSGAIAGTNPQAILDTPLYTIQNPLTQTTGGGEFGGNLYRIGDVNSAAATDCDATPANATCAPDFVIPARNLSYPFLAPSAAFSNAGAAFLFNGRTGAPLVPPGATAAEPVIASPEPQKFAQFSGSYHGGRPVGDVGASTDPDILLPAALHNSHQFTDEGKMWAFNAVGAGGGGSGSWQHATLTDPTPAPGGNFGGGFSGVGDIVATSDSPANEVLVGGFRLDPNTEVNNRVIGDVHFMNVQSNKNLMTIPDPDGAPGNGFGVGIIPLGDLNGDGFLDFAGTAYLSDVAVRDASGAVTCCAAAGKAWIFRSDNSPPPPPPTAPAPQISGPAAPQTQRQAAELLRPGTCANRTMGTDRGERIRGTIAGDEIFGFGGNDSISGYQGRDCIDGESGADRLYGNDDNDKLLGDRGNDRMYGGDGRDELFGGSGRDLLEGGAANDMLAGGSNHDDLLGGSGDDRLFGESGNDRIVAGGGLNQIDGGRGDDSIAARNGERDRIICGSGRDRVHADRYDRLNGCERVRIGGKITNRNVLPPRVQATRAKATGGSTR